MCRKVLCKTESEKSLHVEAAGILLIDIYIQFLPRYLIRTSAAEGGGYGDGAHLVGCTVSWSLLKDLIGDT